MEADGHRNDFIISVLVCSMLSQLSGLRGKKVNFVGTFDIRTFGRTTRHIFSMTMLIKCRFFCSKNNTNYSRNDIVQTTTSICLFTNFVFVSNGDFILIVL